MATSPLSLVTRQVYCPLSSSLTLAIVSVKTLSLATILTRSAMASPMGLLSFIHVAVKPANFNSVAQEKTADSPAAKKIRVNKGDDLDAV